MRLPMERISVNFLYLQRVANSVGKLHKLRNVEALAADVEIVAAGGNGICDLLARKIREAGAQGVDQRFPTLPERRLDRAEEKYCVRFFWKRT